jgi:hypothetical protein
MEHARQATTHDGRRLLAAYSEGLTTAASNLSEYFNIEAEARRSAVLR